MALSSLQYFTRYGKNNTSKLLQIEYRLNHREEDSKTHIEQNHKSAIVDFGVASFALGISWLFLSWFLTNEISNGRAQAVCLSFLQNSKTF